MAGSGNLKPFPKGVSGNPGGAPKLPAELRIARRENMVGLIKLVQTYIKMNPEDAKHRLAGPDCLQLEEMIQGMINRAKEGDTNSFRYLLELACGKIPDQDPVDQGDELTLDQKIEMLSGALAHLKDQKKKGRSVD